MEAERELIRFTQGLTRDGLLADDISTRFEVWHRMEELSKRLSEWMEIEIEERAQDAADDLAEEETDDIISQLQDLVDDLKEHRALGLSSKR